MARKQTIYSGKLATPMPPRKKVGLLGGLSDDPKWMDEYRERWMLLFEHLKVDPAAEDFWVRVALALVEAHVPGLSETQPKRAGRPQTKNSAAEGAGREALLRRVKEMRNRSKSLSEIEACRRVWEEIKRNEPNSHYAKRKLTTVRADIALAKKERGTRNALVAALTDQFSFGLGSDIFGFGPNIIAGGQKNALRSLLRDAAGSLPENPASDSSQKSD